MKIEELFSGIAIIIDNDVDNTSSPIYNIRNNLVKNNIPIVAYREIPTVDVICSFRNASFIIIDWNFIDNTDILNENQERLIGIDELEKAMHRDLILFIRTILEKIFVPIFIFSGYDIGEVEEQLSEEGLYDKEKANRIFVKSKDDVDSQEHLFQCIEDWLRKMPAIYAMKELDYVLQTTKNSMFLEWDSFSSQWVIPVWKMLNEDSIEVEEEFGQFLTRNVVHRIAEFHFDESYFAKEGDVDKKELLNVIEKDCYLKYLDNQPKQAYTGDLFKVDDIYYLNIRAQCDLSRSKDDVKLYLIKGKELLSQNIITQNIFLDFDGNLCFPSKKYSLEQLNSICKGNRDEIEGSKQELETVNELFNRLKSDAFWWQGDIIGKKTDVFLCCADNGKIIKFRLDLEVKKFKDLKDKRIGRVLPPYITKIQQKCSHYIIREGTMPIPKEIFE